MASNCTVDSALDVVKLMEDNIGFKSSALLLLKVDLRFLRTFLRCARKWSSNKGFHCRKSASENKDDDLSRLPSFLLTVEDVVLQNVLVMKSLLAGLDDGIIPQSRFDQVFSKFHETMESFSDEINGFHVALLDCASEFRAPNRDELMKFLDSVLDNTRDVRTYDMKEVAEDLEEKLGFLQNMICFAGMLGVEDQQLEDLMFHAQVVAMRLAHLYYAYAYVGVEEMIFKISDLLQKIKPVQSQVGETYMHVLKISKLSNCQSLKFDEHILVNFMDSVRGNLWEILCSGPDFLDSMMEEHVQLLYDGLSFLRSVLREQHQELNDLHEEMRNLVTDIVIEAGLVSCSLFRTEMEEGLVKNISLALSDLMKKIEFFKSGIADKCPVTTRFNYPRTNVLGYINLLLENLNELLQSSETPAIVSSRDQIQIFHEDLTFTASFMEEIVDKCGEHDEEVQSFRTQAMDVVYKVEFFIDSLVASDHIHYSPILLNKITEEISVLKFEASKIDVNKGNALGEGKSSNKVTSSYAESPPIINEVVVGFEEETEEMKDLLTRGTQELDIVSIVGMAGLGKSTLAKKVYTDPSVLYHFHIRVWSCVSQQYHKHRLLLDILEQTFDKLPPRFAEMHEDDLFEQLYKCLKGKRYLIVLDDVWDIAVWNDLGMLFPNDVNGSRILLTSRLQDVALHANSKLLCLRTLTDNECWDLLKMKLFRGDEDEDCPPDEVSELWTKIAKICKGLPFSIVLVAGILAAMEQHLWAEVVESLSSSSVYGTEQCMATLELSYIHLPNYLKPCLLYLGLFPEDQQVPVCELMWLWIAEGFVSKSELKSLEDIAEGYMMDLRGRSLITVAEQSSSGGIKACRVHDLVHEFCLAKSREDNFVQLLREPGELSTFYEPHGLRRLCVLSEPEHLRRSRLFCPNIHSLSFFNMDKHWHARDPSNVSFLFHFSKFLRVLNLGKIKLGDVFPTEIEFLVQLRYLALCGDIYFIPSSISRLWNLETFILEGFSDEIFLADAVWDMKKLRHLHMNKSLVLPLPDDSIEEDALHNLDSFSTVSIGPETGKIMHLFPNVRRLKCRLSESWDCGGVLELDCLSKLESLRMFSADQIPNELEFIFPENLKKLTLSDFLLPWSEISAIGKLPNLEVLKLLSGAFQGETWDMEEESFPNLKFLKLEFLDLVSWTSCSDDFLPRLQKLVFRNCWKLEEIPSTVGEIPALTMIEVYRCQDSLASLVMEIQEEQLDMGNEVLKILIHASGSGWTDQEQEE